MIGNIVSKGLQPGLFSIAVQYLLLKVKTIAVMRIMRISVSFSWRGGKEGAPESKVDILRMLLMETDLGFWKCAVLYTLVLQIAGI